MPTVLRESGYRFFFFSLEGAEPPHIHVEKAENYAKFRLDPITLVRNHGFRSSELTRIRELIEENRYAFLERWNEHFDR